VTTRGMIMSSARLGGGASSKSGAWPCLIANVVLASIVTAGTADGQTLPNVRLLSQPGVRPSLVGAVYRPPGQKVAPGLLVLHGSAGLRPEYHTYAAKLSQAGYVVLLIDYFADTGPAGAGSDKRLASWSTWEEIVRTAASYLRHLPGVDGDRMGIVGFSRGAWLAFTTLGNAPDIRAIVCYYGVGTQPLRWDARGPSVLMLYGREDQYAGPAFVSEVAAGLRAAGRSVDAHIYDNVGHSFNLSASDDSAVRQATTDAEARARAFLARHLKQAGG
jgi:dienelactone hydrolase